MIKVNGAIIRKIYVGATPIAKVYVGAQLVWTPLPAAPVLTAEVSLAAASIDLSWPAVANALSYKIERAPTSGGVFVEIATGVVGLSYTDDTGLANNTSYYYRARATNGTGDSEYSNEATAKTWLGFDSFERADSTTLGNLESGQAWINYIGARQIQDGAFCSTVTSRGSAVAEYSVTDVKVTVRNRVALDATFPTSGRFVDVQARAASDVNNHNLVQFGNTPTSQILAFKRVGGTYTQVGSTVVEDIPAASDCSLQFVGNAWTVAVDGVTKISASDSANNARTRHGAGSGSVAAKIEYVGVST